MKGGGEREKERFPSQDRPCGSSWVGRDPLSFLSSDFLPEGACGKEKVWTEKFTGSTSENSMKYVTSTCRRLISSRSLRSLFTRSNSFFLLMNIILCIFFRVAFRFMIWDLGLILRANENRYFKVCYYRMQFTKFSKFSNLLLWKILTIHKRCHHLHL